MLINPIFILILVQFFNYFRLFFQYFAYIDFFNLLCWYIVSVVSQVSCGVGVGVGLWDMYMF